MGIFSKPKLPDVPSIPAAPPPTPMALAPRPAQKTPNLGGKRLGGTFLTGSGLASLPSTTGTKSLLGQ